jgi:DNA-directed RNA polymerase specialized sigma24 family protein
MNPFEHMFDLVVLSGQLSNPTRSLSGALRAYRSMPPLASGDGFRSRPLVVTAGQGTTVHAVKQVQRRLGEPEIDEAVRLYQAGATIQQVATQLGVDRKTVSRQLKAQGVTLRLVGLSSTQIEEAIELYGSGLSLAQVGERLGVDAGTVHARLRERGVVFRDTQGRPR